MEEYNEADAKATIAYADAMDTQYRARLQREAADDSRHMVTVREISAIDDIPGADLIKVAQVEGWKVVVKAGEFKVGDLCVFFEVDSFLPLDDERYSFLQKNKITWEGVEGARLRTIRLRKQLSQGLALPLTMFAEIIENLDKQGLWTTSNNPDVRSQIRAMNFTGPLKIMKWDKPVSAQLAGLAKGNFPSFLRKSDQERAQNMARDIFGFDDELVSFAIEGIPGGALTALAAAGELLQKDGVWQKVRKAAASRDTRYEVSLKMDGSSMTVYRRGTVEAADLLEGVCSRNLDLKLEGNEGNSFVALAQAGLLDALRETATNVALQGELMGPGIQGNREEFKTNRFFVYNVFDIESGEFMSPSERAAFIYDLNTTARENGIEITIEHVPILYPSATLAELGIANMEQLLNFAVGPSHTNTVREGLVFKAHDGRHQFKVISNQYLLDEK